MMRSRRRLAIRIVILVAILVVVLYPLFFMIGTAFKSNAEIANNLSIWPREWTPSNFRAG